MEGFRTGILLHSVWRWLDCIHMSSGSPRSLNGFPMGSLHISFTFLRIWEDGTLSPALNDSLRYHGFHPRMEWPGRKSERGREFESRLISISMLFEKLFPI